MALILIADDEPAIVMAIRDELQFEGFDVETAGSGPEAMAVARTKSRPDVLLLDLMLPGQKRIRRVPYAAALSDRTSGSSCSTVRGHEADRVTGFESGADDYVTKPFSLRELVGRIKVGLRRSSHGAAAAG